MTRGEAVNWLINITADIGKAEHRDLWHYEQALSEIRELLESEPERKTGKCVWCDSPFRIEYYWIDREGCTASFQDEERHVVATGIAKFCPNCGADMRG